MKKEENFNIKHPEIRDGEMFLTNMQPLEYLRSSWFTKREGKQAYSVTGALLKWSVPVFIQKVEYDEGMKKYNKKEG